MKSILFVAMATAMLSAGIGTATATEPDENAVEYAVTDSTETAAVDSVLNSRSLGEVTVKGTRATVIQDGVSYIPSKKEKKYSMDPFALLRNMGITSLVVNGTRVSNHFSDEATFFIDGREADVADVQTLLPKDIERVLVLESPGDAKYLGARLAINYITRKSVFGGYTNITADQSFIFNSGDYSLFGKFFNGKSTFQLLGTVGYFSTSGDYGETVEKYDLPREGKENLIINRISTLDDTRRRKTQGAAGFRWMYDRNESFWMRLNGGIDIQKSPHFNSWWGTNTDGDGSAMAYAKEERYSYIVPYIYFNCNKTFSGGSQLYFKTTLNASFNNRESLYNYNQNDPLGIYNKTRETGIAPHFTMNYYIPFGHNNNLQVVLNIDESFYHVRYRGSANEVINNREGKYQLRLVYYQGIKFGQNDFSFRFDTKLPIRHVVADGLPGKTNFTYSNDLSMWLSLGTKSSFVLSAMAWKQSTSLSHMVNVNIKEDDITGTQGNEHQKEPTRYKLSLSYTYLPLGWLEFTMGTSYDHEANSFVTRYEAIDDVVYSSMVNSGVSSYLSFFWSGAVKLFNNSLRISPAVSTFRSYHNGLLSYDFWVVNPSVSISYFGNKGFWCSMSYSPPYPKTHYWGSSSISKSYNHTFMIQAGYTVGNFSCNVSVKPLYRYGHTQLSTHLPGVDIVDNSYSKSMGRSISLSLKYVIDFGRKYAHGNDMYIESERVSSVR